MSERKAGTLRDLFRGPTKQLTNPTRGIGSPQANGDCGQRKLNLGPPLRIAIDRPKALLVSIRTHSTEIARRNRPADVTQRIRLLGSESAVQ